MFHLWVGSVPTGQLTGTTVERPSMFGSVRRSLVQLYHSLGAVVNMDPRPWLTGCAGSPTSTLIDTGSQVFMTKRPVPRKVSKYQGQVQLGLLSLYPL